MTPEDQHPSVPHPPIAQPVGVLDEMDDARSVILLSKEAFSVANELGLDYFEVFQELAKMCLSLNQQYRCTVSPGPPKESP